MTSPQPAEGNMLLNLPMSPPYWHSRFQSSRCAYDLNRLLCLLWIQTGRGGRGNIRSPSRDPPAEIPEEERNIIRHSLETGVVRLARNAPIALIQNRFLSIQLEEAVQATSIAHLHGVNCLLVERNVLPVPRPC